MNERWQDALTQRVKALARLAPLQQVEADKGRRILPLERADVRALALRVLDVIIEEMGLGQGAARELVQAALEPMVRTMLDNEQDAAPVVELVLSGMLNERERRRAFTAVYYDWSAPKATPRELSWHLIRELELPDGSYVLAASTEGINVYTGMLEFDVQDAQVAEEAVLQAQIRRGRIEDAVRTARNARLRSIEYHQTLQRVLRLVQRDVRQVRWVDEVLHTLQEARVHLGDRLQVERELLAMLAARVDSASTEDAPRIAELRDALEDCQGRHVGLHREVLQANQTFLAEQERQLFRPQTVLRLPDLEAEVLQAALEAPAAALANQLEPLVTAFFPPSARPVAYLPQWVDRLLQPPRAAAGPHVFEEHRLEELPSGRPYFSDEDHRRVEALLAELGSRARTLSSLLSELRRRGGAQRAELLLVMRALHGFEPSAGSPLRACAAGRLADPHFGGHELSLTRARGEHDVAVQAPGSRRRSKDPGDRTRHD